MTDEFPYYLRPKKAVFSGLICVAMYLMGLILTTDVSDLQGGAKLGSWAGCYSLQQYFCPAEKSLNSFWSYQGLFPAAGTLVYGGVLPL